jgi:hypothetical protein
MTYVNHRTLMMLSTLTNFNENDVDAIRIQVDDGRNMMKFC